MIIDIFKKGNQLFKPLTKMNDLIRILKLAKHNKNVVIKATRIIRESFIRKFASIIYNLECRLVLRTPIWDVNGTPKVIPARILKQMRLNSDNDLIDAELIMKVINNNISVMEVPIVNVDRISGNSTTSIISGIKMYYGILQLRKKL